MLYQNLDSYELLCVRHMVLTNATSDSERSHKHYHFVLNRWICNKYNVKHAFSILTLIIDLINIMFFMNKRVSKDEMLFIHLISELLWIHAIFSCYCMLRTEPSLKLVKLFCKGKNLSSFAHPVVPSLILYSFFYEVQKKILGRMSFCFPYTKKIDGDLYVIQKSINLCTNGYSL